MAVLKRPISILIIFTMMIVIISVVTTGVSKGEVHAKIVAKEKVMVGEAVFFDGSSSSSSTTDTLNYSWDVDGDGKADAYDKYFTYIYSNSGTHTVTLTVTAGNVSDVATATITVESIFISLMPYFGLTVVAIVLLVFLSLYWRKKDIDNFLRLQKEEKAVPIKKRVIKIVKKIKKKIDERPASPPSTPLGATKPVLKKRKIKTEVKAPRAETPIPQAPPKEGKEEKPPEETVMCPSCGKTISAYAVMCESCGAVFSDEYVCTSCGATVPEDWAECPKCRAKLT